MKKRWIAALLAIALTAVLLPAPAWAAEAGGSAGSRLTGVDREVYDYLKGEITRIAKGARRSTEITVPDLSSLSWTLEELGAEEGSREDILGKLKEKLSQMIHVARIYDCLTADCAYEMFWSDIEYSWGCSFARAGNRAAIKSLTVQFYVSQDYQGGGRTTVSSSKIAAANKAAANAQAIVDRHRDKSDLEKLAAYREEICRLVSYNTAVTGEGAYGDPWQLLYVFDGDPATNVVCEGYAKAFKYLCDLSQFDGNIVCRTAGGTMNAGSHMWNVVRMDDGKNYLVDVTNCDTGTIGADDKLFLAGGTASADGRTYTISKDSCRAVYTYDEQVDGLYTDGYPALSATDYAPEPADPVVPPQTETPTAVRFQDVDPDAYYAEAVAWAVEQGITNGTSDTTFSPGQNCTEAEVYTFLWRAAGSPDSRYKPAAEHSAFWQEALLWYYDMGMVNPNWFDPDALCTRATAVDSIWWAFGRPEGQVAAFADVPPDSPHAYAVGWAVLNEITQGTSDTTFDPDAVCTRGQIVTFLYRAYH